MLILKRHDSRLYPEKMTIFGFVADFVMPHLSIGDSTIQLRPEFFVMISGIKHAVILTHQFIHGVTADFGKQFISISNRTFYISRVNNGMLIQGKFLFFQLS